MSISVVEKNCIFHFSAVEYQQKTQFFVMLKITQPCRCRDDKWKKNIQFGKKSWTIMPFHYIVPSHSTALFLGFVAFNIISYSLLIAELVLIWFGQEHLHFYKHIFNGSYAVLMFICKYYFPSFLPLYDVSQWVQKWQCSHTEFCKKNEIDIFLGC